MRNSDVFVAFGMFIFFGGPFSVFGDESAAELVKKLDPKEEYRHIFKNIPVLFEYFLVALQDKPEVLETDNLMAFADAPYSRAREIDKRDANDKKELTDEITGPTARIADDIFGEVEGLDDPSDESTDNKASSEGVKNDESELTITPEELAEKFAMVEQLLEDYNKK